MLGVCRSGWLAGGGFRRWCGSFRFRLLRLGGPDAGGCTTVGFSRALPPPCAFADRLICPFPPPGNALGVAVALGERTLLRAGPGWPSRTVHSKGDG
ncbi:DUF1684 domain-containing protein [Streptomyces blattellae]|uniref:DUF1684 domain-containing protein n=1 Tax=Streptomyces blattellae TaxID=2569855 RepID=UPI0012BA3282